MYDRFFQAPSEYSYFLVGPRGTGKSTWLKKYYPDAYWIDLNDPSSFRIFTVSPEYLKKVLLETTKKLLSLMKYKKFQIS